MKKILLLLSFLCCLTALESVAQEVRGIETRRVIYEGPEYNIGTGSRYYGWELTNHNSMTVSVAVELWIQDEPNRIVKTQDIILRSGESYIFKREEHVSTHVDYNYSDYDISQYYLTYKAYKLQ